ncbi:zinc finger BED domain-containing protein 4-like isoform X3 [Alosa pseudoharengus]
MVLTWEPVYHPDPQEQQAIERALALWIGRTGLPVRTVEDKDFIGMMAVVDSRLEIPNKTKISNLIEGIYEDERKKFKERLATARKLTIGLGIWTTKGLGASFLSISACYFCTMQNQPQHILLGLEEISHPLAAHSIKVCLDRCTELWGIPENKILTIITSNGGKLAAALRLEEEESSSTDSEDDGRSEGEYEDEETRYGALTIERTPCFVHTLQDVVNMIYKEVSVTRLLEKVRAVVKQFCRSSSAMEKLGQPFGLTLTKDRVTRWSSTYQMISQLIQGKDSVVQVANEMGLSCLLSDEWLKMIAVRDLLLPFADHVVTLQSDTMSLSLIVPALLDLTSHLTQFSLESAHRDLRGLAQKMKVNLEQCFSCFLFPSETKFSPLAAAACLLDPTVSRDALIDNTDDGIQELLNEAEKFVLSASTTIKDEDELDRDYGDVSWNVVKEEPLSKRPRFRFLSAKLASSKRPKPPMTKTLQELRKYKEELSSQNISDFETGMDFWLAQNSMTYVTLKPLALDLLAMPASQAFAERAFSFTGDLTRSRCKRARMIWERSAFLKLNQDK